MYRLVIQNLAVLALLVAIQILIVVGIGEIPGRLDLHWLWRIALFSIAYLVVGGIAYRFYYGSRFSRYCFVAITPALTVLAVIAVISTDPAYPYAELLLIIPLSGFALAGGFISDRLSPRSDQSPGAWQSN